MLTLAAYLDNLTLVAKIGRYARAHLFVSRQLCERQIEALEEAKRKERAKSFACRVTIVEPAADGRGVAGAGGVSSARERYGTGYFTLDEDF